MSSASPHSPCVIRPVSGPDELPAWLEAVAVGFLRAEKLSEEEVAYRREIVDLDRAVGAYDKRAGRWVGTFRSFDQELTLPGGATVPVCAVTNVTVTATHRRQGLLRAMMAEEMAAAKERGDVCSTLIAAEYPIYGRYGFGPACWSTDFEISLPHSGLDRQRPPAPADGGAVELVDAEEVRRIGPELHERFRREPGNAGALDRPEVWWDIRTGALRYPGDGFPAVFRAVHRDSAGVVQGMAFYQVHNKWQAKRPEGVVEVSHLTATTTAAERSLWHFLLSVDWTTTLRAGNRPADDLLPLLLPDPRAARITSYADYLWVRPLDVPRLLAARSYPVEDSLVLEVRDPAGLANGRFRLTTGPTGAECTPSTADPDLTLPVDELGVLSLGDESAGRLLRLGRIDEHRPGAAARADVLFRTPRRAWCPDIF